jgi:hypothetical protein
MGVLIFGDGLERVVHSCIYIASCSAGSFSSLASCQGCALEQKNRKFMIPTHFLPSLHVVLQLPLES